MNHHATLQTAIEARARHAEDFLGDVELVDVETYDLGVAALESPEAFAGWLCEPSSYLRNQTPLSCLRTDAGRREVRRLLSAIEYGVYL
jgi:uncharacterized protein (DUF2384 family)